MRAEHAAVGVRLVDHDVREVAEHVGPAAVVRQHADVQHVRVREDRVGEAAHEMALLARRVAVVDRRPQAEPVVAQGARLILGERLRRVDVERARRLPLAHGREHGQRERERLAARRAGRDAHVLAALRRLPDVRLVAVEARDAGADQRRLHARVEVARERREDGRARRLAALEDERAVVAAAACEHVVEGRAHAGSRGSASETSAASTARPAAPTSAVRSDVLSASTPSSGLASEPRPMLRPERHARGEADVPRQRALGDHDDRVEVHLADEPDQRDQREQQRAAARPG